MQRYYKLRENWLMVSQFVIGKDRETINQTVSALGWRKAGRASWLKHDGTEVHYLHFAEQIAAVTAGDTVHIVELREGWLMWVVFLLTAYTMSKGI